jgi:RND family efflux transporter MFP subunit
LSVVGSLLVLAGMSVPGCGKPPARVEPPPPRVTVAQPEARKLVEFDTYNGWLQARESVEVRARVRGHIDRVAFTDGDLVKEGQLLFELDPRPFQQELERAQEQVLVAEAQAEYARAEYKRLSGMRGSGAASVVETEKALADMKSRDAQAEAAKREVARRRLDLEYAKVVAPISGRVSRAMMTKGNLVNAGGSDPLLTTIASVDPIAVYFSVDERALQRYSRMRPASATRPVSGKIDDLKLGFNFALETDQGFPNKGMLDFADNTVDRATGTILIRGLIANPDGKFVPGSRVQIRVILGEGSESIVIPDTAILSDQDRKYVLIVDEKNVVQRRDVTLGKLLDDGMRVVLADSTPGKGLSVMDRFVTQGLQAARISYPVEVVAPAAQPSK